MAEFDRADLARFRGIAELAVGIGAGVVSRAKGHAAEGERAKGFGDYVTDADRKS